MDGDTWKKGRELIKNMPELITTSRFEWRENGTGDNFKLLCSVLKGNAIPIKMLNLNSDEKEMRLKKSTMKMI